MNILSSYEATLLTGWEDVYKKSQLTLYILLALKNGPKHMAEIKQWVSDTTNGNMQADDKSVYRALRRFKDAQMINFTLRAGRKGPDVKQYYLTTIGRNVLEQFVSRNISQVLFTKHMQQLIKEKNN